MRDFYTPAEVADACFCSTITIIRLFNSGEIKGVFHVPGSRHRRILGRDLRAYMVANGIPTDRLDKKESR